MLAHISRDRLYPVAAGLYIVGAVALGAQSVGHEYSHRTLGMLLAQPIDRWRILATKLAVLVPSLAALALLAGSVFIVGFGEHYVVSRNSYPFAWMAIPAVVGLCLAPWLTMACRGALAGSVFAVALPLVVLVTAKLNQLTDNQAMAAIYALCAFGALMTCRSLLRLEAIDGPQTEIDLPGWLHRQSIDETAPTLVRSPVWLLVRKELHLQQMTLLISALFVAIWIGTLTLRRVVPADFQGPDLFSTAMLHGWFVVMVAGALPSAEERQLGTIAWQSLMPMATWRQWAIKAGVTMTLGFALAVGLPMLLTSIAPDGNNFPIGWELIVPVAVISASALYVSSLNSSGMRAILAMFPAAAGAALFGGIVLFPVGNMAARLFRPYAPHVTPFAFNGYSEFRHWNDVMSAVMLTPLALGAVWLILAFGLANHRAADRSTLRIRWQVNWIVLYALVATILFYLVSELLRAGLQR
jgi:ABC-type transport system involved in multi-copper enzyme maturation permease subunit